MSESPEESLEEVVYPDYPWVAEIQAQIKDLQDRQDALETKRPGRKEKPILESKEGVCGLDPTRDSKNCPEASIYRYQRGCLGETCVKINREYYSEYRKNKRKTTSTVQVDGEALVGSSEEA